MGNLNRVMLIGRLGKDPEVRYTQNGQPVCSFSMATTERYKVGEDWQERTEWHNIVFFGKRGETLAQYVKKGHQLYIEGRLQTRKWQDRNGNDRYTTEVVARDFQFLEGRREGGTTRTSEEPPPPADADFGSPGMPEDDDIPF